MNASFPNELPPGLLRRIHRSEPWRHWLRVGSFVLLYVLGAFLAVHLAEAAESPWQWLLVIPGWLLAAASLHGISLMTHEAVHGTLSKNRRWNNLAGALCAMPVLQIFTAYRVLHLRHHQHLGHVGDPDHYANYSRWTWVVFCMNWLRLLIGYPVYIAAIPLLGFGHGRAKDRWGILAEILLAAVVIGLVLWSAVPSVWLWHGWVVPMLFINTMVNIRGMSQHTLLEEAEDEVRGTRSILTCPLVRFFMCNENYHLEHHLYPSVPWHQLPDVHRALKDDLKKRGAPYISGYAAFVGDFFVHSLRRSPLGWKHHRVKM